MKTWKQHEWKQKCCHSSSPSLPRTAMAQVLLGRWLLYFEVSLSMTPCLNCSWCCFFGIRMCVTGWLPSRAASHIWCSLWSNRTGSVPPAWSLWGAAEEKRHGFIQAYWPDRLGGSPSLHLRKRALLGSPKPVWCPTVLNTVWPHPHSSILLGCVVQSLLLSPNGPEPVVVAQPSPVYYSALPTALQHMYKTLVHQSRCALWGRGLYSSGGQHYTVWEGLMEHLH